MRFIRVHALRGHGLLAGIIGAGVTAVTNTRDGARTPRHPAGRAARAGAPAAITPGGRSVVTTEFAPITQRSPISTPPVTTQLTPNQQLEPIRTGPLRLEALPGDRLGRVVVAVVGVADEAVVGEHHVVADLDQLERGEHRVAVEEAALADPDPGLGRERQPAAGLEQRPLADLEPP